MQSIDYKIETWKKKLLDSGKRNRLINFKETKRSNINIQDPTLPSLYKLLVNDEKSLCFSYPIEKGLDLDYNVFEAENTSKSEIHVIARDLTTNQTIIEQQKTLKSLRYKAKTTLEEQGINVLYLAFGFLNWKESQQSSQVFSSPLILVPVTLTIESLASPYVLQIHDDEIVLNPTLRYKLETDYNIILEEFDSENNDIGTYLDSVKLQLKNYNWTVEEKVSLSIFSFTKINMYTDLHKHLEKAKNNFAIKALCGDITGLPCFEESLNDYEHDTEDKPIEIFQTVDADSSQQDAVLLSKKGYSFVLQGPPGTGKSQTITNIISESLANGKKVLFVSEKMAALDVVYNRLEKVGLSDFCLTLHNHKANKKAILNSLEKVFNLEHLRIKDDAYYDLDVLQKERNHLNNYVKELHTPHSPLGKSIYEVNGILAKLKNIPNIIFSFPAVNTTNAESLRNCEYLLHDFAKTMGKLSDSYDSNVWKGCNVNQVTHELRHNIETKATSIISYLTPLLESFIPKFETVQFYNPITFEKLHKIYKLFSLCKNAYSLPKELFAERNNLQLIIDLNKKVESILALYKKDIFNIDYNEILNRFTTKYTSIFRVLNPIYWRDKKTFQSYMCNPKNKCSYKELSSLLTSIKFIKECPLLQNNCITSDWETNATILTWIKDFYESVIENSLSDDFIEKVLTCHYGEIYNEILTTIENLEKVVSDDFKWIDNLYEEKYQISALPLAEATKKLTKCINSLQDLEEWIDFKYAHKNCVTNGLNDVVEVILKEKIASEHVVESFKKRFYTLWLDFVSQRSSSVLYFRRKTHEEMIERFQYLDKKQMEIATLRVKEKLLNQLPKKDAITSAFDEVGILKKEFLKQRKIMPVRKLFAKIPNLLPTLKPCLMMSPLSVSLFLESELYSFDLVIFDEASQVFTENALGAIMRSKQIIVAGDNKQLPPTNFFNSTTQELEYDVDSDDEDNSYESILDEMLTIFPERSLKWHYRSKNEELITFSNRKIYNSSLITFPSLNGGAENNGVEYVYVENGIYDRGGRKNNIIEAKKVATLVFEHYKNNPTRTLGVIAFSESQQHTIEDEIVKLRIENPLFESFFSEEKEEAFFVKNIENVQGDERDTIIFSIGYAKDTNGVMYMNFGPLSRNEGYRRLNVAITRAKYNIKLVGSIRPTDIQLEKTNSEGVKMLRSYIEFALDKNSLNKDISFNSVVDVDSPFEEAVYDFLISKNYKVSTQIGCSGYRIDMAVHHPNFDSNFIIGIECDGATYHSSRTARERDRLRQTILEDMGWKFHRIWSTDWIKDPLAEGELLIQAVEKAIETYADNFSEITSKKKVNSSVRKDYYEKIKVKEAQEDALSKSYFDTYKEVSLPYVEDNDFSKPILYNSITQVVNTEYPIHYELLCKRIAPICGNQKITVKVRDEVDSGLEYLNDVIQKRGNFLYPKNYAKILPRSPAEGQVTRPINYLSNEEVSSALLLVVTESFGITKESLFQVVAKEFGFTRIGQSIFDLFEQALNALIATKKLDIVENKVVLCELL